MASNYMYYGDNLDILRHRIQTESVDLIYLLTDAPNNVAKMLESLVTFIGRNNNVTAYLVMMTQRLVEPHRVLKPTGSRRLGMSRR